MGLTMHGEKIYVNEFVTVQQEYIDRKVHKQNAWNNVLKCLPFLSACFMLFIVNAVYVFKVICTWI